MNSRSARRARAGPRLHPDVEILRVGPRSFLLRDARTAHSFQLGALERQMVRAIQETETPEAAALDCMQATGTTVSARTVRELVEQLRTAGLLDLDQAAESVVVPSATPEDGDTHARSPWVAHWNALFDLGAIAFGWAIHPVTVAVVAVLAAMGATAVVRGLDRYLSELSALFDHVPLVLLAALSLAKTLLLVNVPRETAVGVACRKHGVWVRGFRIHWILGLVPFIHCELGDGVARLTGRAKWLTLTAGLVCQSGIAGVAAIGWAMTDPRSDLSTFWLLLLPACLAHMALHVFIFLRFDCYRLLCAAVGDWRLRERALAETRAWLGRRVSPEPLRRGERAWLRAYGLGYHVLVWGGGTALLIAVLVWIESRMGPNGLLVALAIGLWGHRRELGSWFIATPPWRWVERRIGALATRALASTTIVALSIAGLLWPYPLEVSGPCQVVSSDLAAVRATVAGTVAEVAVRTGDRVAEGTVLMRLDEPSLTRELGEARATLSREQARLARIEAGPRAEDLAVAEAEARSARADLALAESRLARAEKLAVARATSDREVDETRRRRDAAFHTARIHELELAALRSGSRPETIAAARADVERWAVRVAQLEDEAARLAIHAPHAGRVVSSDVESRLGQHVHRGDLLIRIERDEPSEVEVAAAEEAIARVEDGMPATIRLTGLGGRALGGHVVHVAGATETLARIRVPRYRTEREAFQESARGDRAGQYVRVLVRLDESSHRLGPGLTGFARIRVAPDRLYTAIGRSVLGYLRTDVWSWFP